MNKYHHYRRNHSSLHSIAATPILDSGYNRYYSYFGPELLLERWIHGYVALPLIRSFLHFIQRFHVAKAYTVTRNKFSRNENYPATPPLSTLLLFIVQEQPTVLIAYNLKYKLVY
jgi:hypothetical protein